MRHYNIAIMPGDGISRVITDGVVALKTVAEDGGLKFEPITMTGALNRTFAKRDDAFRRIEGVGGRRF